MRTGARFGSVIAAAALLAAPGAAQVRSAEWKDDPFPSRYTPAPSGDMLLRGDRKSVV